MSFDQSRLKQDSSLMIIVNIQKTFVNSVKVSELKNYFTTLFQFTISCFFIRSCAELGGISPHNKLKAISFETMPCNPNKRL